MRHSCSLFTPQIQLTKETMNIDNYSVILEKAFELGKVNHPDAPNQHHAAFANSVACFVTGASGGYGGPSVREHTSERMGSREKRMGKWTFEDAVKFCDNPCYGELTDYHKEIFKVEHCFDDTKEDLEILQNRFPD
jgi:hypothetical protein